MNLNSVSFCNDYLGFLFKEPFKEPILSLERYVFFIGCVIIIATFIVIFLPEDIDENRVDKGVFETYSIINKMRSNEYLMTLAVILLFSRISQIFFWGIAPLILVQKGISEQTLSNISTMVMPVELLTTYYTVNFKSDFLYKYLNFCKYLSIIYFFELIFFIGYDYWSQISNPTVIIIVIFIIEVIKTIFAQLVYICIQGFFHHVSDKKVGVTYITAIYTINNLSYKWPGIFIYSAMDIFGYEFVGIASLLYSVFFYNFFYYKMIALEKADPSVWLIPYKEKSE
jgi:hypothetical protein